MNARWLADAADGDGGALARLRRHAAGLLEARGHPLYVTSLVTSVITGWDGCFPESVFDHPELFVPVPHGGALAAPVPIGALAEVPTTTTLGGLFGEVVCAHPDPERYDVDGQLVDAAAGAAAVARRRAVVAFDCMPAAIREDLDDVKMDRIRRAGTWLTPEGHVVYRASDDGLGDLERYCRWLAHPDRAEVRGGLPGDAGQLRQVLETLVAELSGYRSTFITFGRWVWLRDAFIDMLTDEGGRLSRVELSRTFGLLSATYGKAQVRRTAAFELADASRGWSDVDREQLLSGTAWVRALFTMNAFVDERLSGGAPVVATRDGPVRVEPERSWGLAGLWHVDALSDDQVEELRAVARDEAEDRAIAAAGRDLAAVAPFPFSTRLSAEEFEEGVVVLPGEVVEKLSRDEVTVRLAFTPQGRFAASPVAVATTGRPDGSGRVPLEWPALLEIGAKLEGKVTRRGRMVELTPAP